MDSAQLAAIKAAIDGNPTWAAYPQTPDGHFALAGLLNAPSSPAFSVWQTGCPRKLVLNATDGSLYTPNASLADADIPLSLTVEQRTAQLMAAQTKVMLLDIVLRQDTVDFSQPNIRKWVQDAVTKCPTGNLGANRHPGGSADGAAVLTVGTRNAREVERILAAPSAPADTVGSVTARVMAFEGQITGPEVQQARELT